MVFMAEHLNLNEADLNGLEWIRQLEALDDDVAIAKARLSWKAYLTEEDALTDEDA